MKEILFKDVKTFQKHYQENAMNKVIENAIVQNGIQDVCYDFERKKENQNVFNIELEKGKIYDQKQSGRCWLFAGLNLIKQDIAKNMKVKPEELELSANYLNFFDRLEKANTIYESVIHSQKDDFSYLNEEKMTEFEEGGYFENFRALILKYGIVPISYMPETHDSVSSSAFNALLREKIKRDVYTLLHLKKKKTSVAKLEETTKEMLGEVYAMLAKVLGEPVGEFTLEYYDKDQKYVCIPSMTPQKFLKKYLKLHLEDFYAFGNMEMYNKELYKKYEKKYANSLNTDRVCFLNVSIEELKKMVIDQLRGKMPVWFGSEVLKMRYQKDGILDSKIYNYEQVFSFPLLNRKENLELFDVHCDHAMSFVGVHIEEERPIRWKVENSWGDKDNKGYFVMNDNYFDEFVYEVIIHKKFVPKKLLELWNQPSISIDWNDPY